MRSQSRQSDIEFDPKSIAARERPGGAGLEQLDATGHGSALAASLQGLGAPTGAC